jgi:hypothetical protein
MTLKHAIAILEIASESARSNGIVALDENNHQRAAQMAEHVASFDQAISILNAVKE